MLQHYNRTRYVTSCECLHFGWGCLESIDYFWALINEVVFGERVTGWNYTAQDRVHNQQMKASLNYNNVVSHLTVMKYKGYFGNYGTISPNGAAGGIEFPHIFGYREIGAKRKEQTSKRHTCPNTLARIGCH